MVYYTPNRKEGSLNLIFLANLYWNQCGNSGKFYVYRTLEMCAKQSEAPNNHKLQSVRRTVRISWTKRSFSTDKISLVAPTSSSASEYCRKIWSLKRQILENISRSISLHSFDFSSFDSCSNFVKLTLSGAKILSACSEWLPTLLKQFCVFSSLSNSDFSC